MRIAVLGLLCVVSPAIAGSGGPSLESSYASDGVAQLGFDIGGDLDDRATAATLAPDGSVLIGGAIDLAAHSGVGDDNYHQLGLIKFTPAGVPDTTFGPNHDGRVELAIIPNSGVGDLGDVMNTADEHIALIADYGTSITGSSHFIEVGRLNADGSPDTTFNAVGYRILTETSFIAGANQTACGRILPLAGGKLLALCNIFRTDGGATAVLVKLNSDGSYDSSFGAGAGYILYTSPLTTGPTYFASQTMLLQSDGKLLLAGVANHGTDGSNGDMAILRVGSDGTPDESFGTHGWAFVAFDRGQSLYDAAAALAFDSSGRIVVAGDFENSTTEEWGVARLSANGQLDTTFATLGRASIDFGLGAANPEFANTVVCLPDGRILVGGSVTSGNYTLAAAAMLKANGTADATFGNAGLYVDSDPSFPYARAVIGATTLQVRGDDIYLPGSLYKSTGSDKDFGVKRLELSLFKDGFDGG